MRLKLESLIFKISFKIIKINEHRLREEVLFNYEKSAQSKGWTNGL